MTIEIDGKTVSTTATGFLENIEDLSERVAVQIAQSEAVELTERHWDLINYLRDEFIGNAGNQPNMRNIVNPEIS